MKFSSSDQKVSFRLPVKRPFAALTTSKKTVRCAHYKYEVSALPRGRNSYAAKPEDGGLGGAGVTAN